MARSNATRPTAWERTDGKRGPAPSHSHDELAAAGLDLADHGGLSAVSTRRIAQQLGVSQSALYRYVSDRADILDLIVDAAAGEIDIDVPLSGAAIDDLTALAHRTKSVHVQHPWLLEIPVEPMRVGPRGIDYLEYALRAMAAIDVPGQVKLQTIAVLNTLVQQFARTEIGDAARSQRRAGQSRYLHEVAEQGHHRYLAAALETSNRDDQPSDMFEPVLRRVLRGVLGPN